MKIIRQSLKLHTQFFYFLISGTLGFIVDTAVLYAMLYVGFNPYEGRFISFIAALCTTWFVNTRLTFKAKAESNKKNQLLRYVIAMTFGGAVNYSVYSAVVFLGGQGRFIPFFALVAGSLAGLFLNFYNAKRWVF
ncbi:MAG: GtrA family protein [Pseudomonadota bacterium]